MSGGVGVIFGAAHAAPTLATTTVTSTTTSDALTRSCSKMPASSPTITAASVAAACPMESEKIIAIEIGGKPPMRPATAAAAALPITTTASAPAASPSVRGSVNCDGSISMPVEIRKNGISTAEPKNSRVCASWLRSGISRFRPRPAKKAPTMPSMPTACARNAHAVNAASAPTNRTARSRPGPAKNQRSTRGSASMAKQIRTARPSSSFTTIAAGAPDPSWTPTTRASTNSASVSVMTVPETAIDTARSPPRPYWRAIG